MGKQTISIEVDEETAQAFAEATPGERRKLELLLRLHLRNLVRKPIRPLKQIMDEIGQEAEARGLTPEVLDALLNDDFDCCLENDSRFLQRMAAARQSLRAGQGVRLEDVK